MSIRRNFFATHGLAVVLGAVGRIMVTTGVVLLLLVAYQLWGTNLQTDRSQAELRERFAAEAEARTSAGAARPAPAVSTTALPRNTTPGTASATTTAPAEVAASTGPIAEGTPVGRISIPSIGLRDFYVVEGTSVAQLKRGAGHYESTPLPGQKGNAAIAGHRTTYGAPFHNIDKAAIGDLIVVDTFQGRFRYEVTEQRIVAPSDVSVLDDRGDNRLTLTACHPKYSARQRIIVSAELVGDTVPELPGQRASDPTKKAASAPEARTVPRTSIDDYPSEPIIRVPGAWWGVACAAVWLLVLVVAPVARRRRRHLQWIPYLVGTPICLVLLYLFFENFSYEAFAQAIGLAV